jgi:predicted nucleic acid-binding protein
VKVFFDTSILVAAMLEHHPAHERALPWLQRIKKGTDSGVISAHSVAELYSILTTLPVRPRISPVAARRLIEENVLESCEVVALSDRDYADLLVHLASVGIVGGTTYDALILHAATKVEIDRIVTLNERHFRQAYPALIDKLVAP